MLMMSDDQLSRCEVPLGLLERCLQITDLFQQQDVAVLMTSDGILVASTQAWQQKLLELVNLIALAAVQGVIIKAYMVADGRSIRGHLHDTDAKRQLGQQTDSLELDHTRAQQALEDLVLQALVLEASDIHLLFLPSHAALAFRVHGRLVGQVERHRETMAAAIAAALNTRSEDFRELFDEQRLSSASISLSVMHEQAIKNLRLRVQKSPTRNGFAVTMRIQAEHEQARELAELGLPMHQLNQIQKLLQNPAGLLVVAGPTGQGKTTTLAAINWAIPRTAKVISLEDPIEIIQPYIEQKPVIADHQELNFANMVRVALREDPDVISISEIRDQATAKAAYTAALTGHLVTATVHAHDTFGVIQRLLDLGLSAESLAQVGVLRGIVAQRLVAKPCLACEGTDRGCPQCHGTGVIGRRLVAELLLVDEGVRDAIRNGTLEACRNQLMKTGWVALDEQLKQVALCI
ncbi:GspE/PulE family protein [Pseudidiomarina donghaiensis]|uniref:Bacterial type II secretion system protein E domain-containing protein n=1 Tax=Pseudidiomarina donghaiensis TaxID=519452 RepID=A0A432XLB2_9GAMM|nr:ATPase, T2SS/T4P/T4SS family [Pseudidiomarina donghaiensis]RUO49476.1 hypothetical protein CWE24_02960 [Pseudidiomarina donghaiensis]SFV21320.1 general secretion pathway protein E [Pseudidiomarina donghaiensis]